MSYRKRIADINRIYDEHVKSGLSNREIWLRYVYPVYAICERTFYSMLKASADPDKQIEEMPSLFDSYGDGREHTEEDNC